MPAPMRRFHGSVACSGGLLPAPMRRFHCSVACPDAPFPLFCCLPRCAVSIALLPAPMRRFHCSVACPDVGPRLPGIARGGLRRPDGALSCEVRWLGPGLGQFCRRSRALEGEPRPSGWCSGCFACGVGLSKAYRHFARVISLTKCGGAGKAEPLCRAAPQPPTRIPVSL